MIPTRMEFFSELDKQRQFNASRRNSGLHNELTN
jgi:hypothetical protein